MTKRTVANAYTTIKWLASVGVLLGALIYAGRTMQQVDHNTGRLQSIGPRLGRVESEVSGISAKQEVMHQDLRDIKGDIKELLKQRK